VNENSVHGAILSVSFHFSINLFAVQFWWATRRKEASVSERNTMKERRLDSTCSGQEQVAGFCEHANEP
jgi:hypothetical protein